MDDMTNESLQGICINHFELTHYAIALGRYYIASGREVDLSELLKEVRKHPNPNYVDELKAIDAHLDSKKSDMEWPEKS